MSLVVVWAEVGARKFYEVLFPKPYNRQSDQYLKCTTREPSTCGIGQASMCFLLVVD